MIKHLYSIRDAKGEVFGTPFSQLTHGEAERSFARAVADPQTMMSQFPEDYDLYYLGTFDDSTGQFATLDSPQHVQKAVLLKRPEKVGNAGA